MIIRLRSYVTQRPPFDVKNPYMAPIKVNRNIHNSGSGRHCMHIEVDIEGIRSVSHLSCGLTLLVSRQQDQI